MSNSNKISNNNRVSEELIEEIELTMDSILADITNLQRKVLGGR